MVNTVKKLEEFTKEITRIMLRAQSSFRIMDYLYRERKGLELEVINNYPFLKYTAETHWRLYVIELSKLLKNNKGEFFNLHKFIDKFKQGKEFEIIAGIDAVTIARWEASLKLEESNIEKLIGQRDKLYGHTDKDYLSVRNTLSFVKARELIEVVQNVITEIHDKVFNQGISYNPIGEPLEDLKKIIAVLVDRKRETIEMYKEICKAENIDPKEMGL